MKAFSFIHAADLHIDSPFVGVTAQSEKIARQLRSATTRAFENIVEKAIENKVDFVIFAGDIYDGADRSISAQMKFLAGLQKLSENGIRSFVAHGNHDPLNGWAASIEWPELTEIFRCDVETFIVTKNEEPIAAVAGISYLTSREERNLARSFSTADAIRHENLFRIAVLHCNVGNSPAHSNYAPCALNDLTKQTYHYWALGHVHERAVLSEHPAVVYPGNTQGRHIRERGPRGCYLVQVSDNGQPTLLPLHTDVIRWSSETVSIDDASTINDLVARIDTAVCKMRKEAGGLPVICRIEISGRSSLFHELSDNQRIHDLLVECRAKYQHDDNFCWIEQFDFNCKPDIDLDAARDRGDLLSFVLREAQDLRQGGLESVSSDCFAPLDNHAAVRTARLAPADLDINQLLQEAEMLAADLLENE